MLLRSFAALLALAIAPLAVRAADEVNPYKDAKVGDYVKYTIKGKAGPIPLDGTLTQIVTAKTDKQVTIKFSGKLGDTDLPEQEEKIDLTKPFDPTKAGQLPIGGDAKIEKLKEGKEKIKVNGKEYDCAWTTYKFTAKLMNIDFAGEIKAWTAKDLPAGMVKMTMTGNVLMQDVNMTMELAETGNMKKKD
ncbi:MAG: hypothetical protein L0241_27820 [Planctomycetia bacterium]|nr:hypothetical protein [Planctomycetia bacterium]